MAKNFLITLPLLTTSPGPFNIYYDIISDSNLVAATPSSATKASLLSGVYIIVSDDVNNIYLENLAEGCGNIELVNVNPTTTTTTSTTTTTTAAPTTTTTTAAPTTTTTTAAPTTTTTTAAPTTTTTTAAPTTTTTTAAPTTTTTTTLTAYQYGLYGYANDPSDACGQTGTYVQFGPPQLQVFSTSATPSGVTIFYNDNTIPPNNPYVTSGTPDGKYILFSLASNPSDYYFGYYNRTTGAITGVNDCTP